MTALSLARSRLFQRLVAGTFLVFARVTCETMRVRCSIDATASSMVAVIFVVVLFECVMAEAAEESLGLRVIIVIK